jgi:ribose-phosphate pyrophosphokinase
LRARSLYGDREASPNDKLCRLLFFAAAVRDAGAGRVTAVIPYLAYARKDRRSQLRDPITTRYVAQLIEAVGVDRVVVVDVHNLAAFENAFRCPSVHLEARPLFVAHLLSLLREQAAVIVSPDAGGAKRAELPLFRLARGHAPALVIKTAQQHRQLCCKVDGILGAKPITQGMQGSSERQVSKMPIVRMQMVHHGLEPANGFLNRGVEHR